MTSPDPGFCIVPEVFEAGEIEPLLAIMNGPLPSRTKAGARHLLAVPAVREVAADPRLRNLAREFLGGSPVAFRATLFDKSPEANWVVVWHQDTALPLCQRVDLDGWGPWSIKSGVLYAHAPADVLARIVALRIHLDDQTHRNGPLRVLPGTHAHGVLSDAQIEQFARETPPVDCLAPAGGVVVMRPLLVHASSKLRELRPRRVLHIEYAAQRQVAPQMELAVA